MATRNYINKPLTFQVYEDVKNDNHKSSYSFKDDGYSRADKYYDKPYDEKINIKIDNEDNGEATFTLPTNAHWEGAHKKGQEGIPRYFYLKEIESEVEFPRAYYLANPNTKEPKTKNTQEKIETKKQNPNRIKALMLKVAKEIPCNLREVRNANAVILGEELKLVQGGKEEKEKCECEARVRAFMRMLRVKEGTTGEKGYTMLFAKKDFVKDYDKDMSTHPKVVVHASGYSSSAAGAYQIMQDTYFDKGFTKNRNKYNIKSFDQESQDKLCLVILKHNYVNDRPNSFYNPVYWTDTSKTIRDTARENLAKERRKRFKGQNGDIIQMLIDNNYEKAVLLSALCWASLPDAPYGQPTGTKEECKANYKKFLKEELANKSDLYLKKGFLKELGVSCNCGAAENLVGEKGNEDTTVVVLTGEIIGTGSASSHRGEYYMYKLNIYEGISYETYNKKKKLLKPTSTHELSRDSWNNAKGRSEKRYGPKNETPPGVYWLTYYPNGIGSKGYKLKVSDTKDDDFINGKDGTREGIRIHHYSPHFAEGCITTGNNEASSVKELVNKIPALKKQPIRMVIEDRKAEYDKEKKYYKGIK